MRLSLNITEFSWPGGPTRLAAELGRIARQADEGGLDTLWVSDHLLQAVPGTDPSDAILEAYTTLGHLSALTSQIRLGTMVSAVTYRPPALLVKAVTTLDVLSGGRAWMGIGAGYHQAEAEMLGLPLPPIGERYEHLEDTLRIALRMWSGDDSTFEGARHKLARPVSGPSPVSSPHPPILIGGAGERRTLPLVARYAQACNLFDIPDGGATIRRKLAVLAEHCEAAGTSFEAISKTVSTRLEPGETPESLTGRARALADLGIDQLIVLTSGPWTPEAIECLTTSATALQNQP